MDLTTARENIGRPVVYVPADYSPAEYGVITSVGRKRFVFVRYGDDTGSLATDPAALTLVREETQIEPPEKETPDAS